MKKYAIIILNWNGADDTVECLKSLLNSSLSNFDVIVLDNHSTDDSIKKIKGWCEANTLFQYTQEADFLSIPLFNDMPLDRPRFLLVENEKNYGFAAGNNIGIRRSLQDNYSFIGLLNNDTCVDSLFLEEIDKFFVTHTEYDVATPDIFYYDQPDKSWNSGGQLTITGSRKYFYSHNINPAKKNDYLNINFVSGCAFFARAEIFKSVGLLCEDFFFGEEDYNYALRMKQKDIKAACVLKAKIFHKVNKSANNLYDKRIAGVALFYVNRFVDMKKFYPYSYWLIWRYLTFCYVIPMLILKCKIRSSVVYKIVNLALFYSHCEKVTEEIIIDIKKQTTVSGKI